MRRPFPGRDLWIRAGLLASMLASGARLAVAEDQRAGRPRPPEYARPGLDAGWSGMAGLALVLAVGGGIAVAARRLAPRAGAGDVRVVGRVSLSPRHSVYLLRVGRRVLVLGAGPQGPPALLTELDDVPQDPPPTPQVSNHDAGI